MADFVLKNKPFHEKKLTEMLKTNKIRVNEKKANSYSYPIPTLFL